MTVNVDQKIEALQERVDALFKEMQAVKDEADSLLNEVQVNGALELSSETLDKAQAIRKELGISAKDLAKAATKFHVLQEKADHCHWCTGSAGV